MLKIIPLLLCFVATLANAAPKQLTAVYQATRNGQPFATVSETFRQENGKYRIESITEGLGAYALFGKRRLLSEGEVTAEGLRPRHFEQHLSNNEKKSIIADFNWETKTLSMKVKHSVTTATLEKGTQDITSMAYQFMFAQPTGNELVLPVTTGKKLKTYRYKVADRGLPLEIAAGKFKTLHLVDTDTSGDERELWLGNESQHIPVRLSSRDDSGGKIEQTLTSLHVE